MRYMKSDGFTALDDDALGAAASFFDALAHPVRLRIVCGLLDGDCCVGPMTDCLGLPQAFVSRHLGILRRAGIVTSVVEGRQRVYSVRHPAVRPLVLLLKHQFQTATP